MKTIVIDDEMIANEIFEMETKSNTLIDLVGQFTDPSCAIEYARKYMIDLAVLDIQMNISFNSILFHTQWI